IPQDDPNSHASAEYRANPKCAKPDERVERDYENRDEPTEGAAQDSDKDRPESAFDADLHAETSISLYWQRLSGLFRPSGSSRFFDRRAVCGEVPHVPGL